MLDGRHTGTGGGNHIIIGWTDAGRQPDFCGGPDLLRILLAYWQNHPSLSICSRACLLARRARLRAWMKRATTALRTGDRLPADPGRTRPHAAVAGRSAVSHIFWSMSRAIRTAPSSASTSSTRPIRRNGRLGLVELRAFEMPPHARMSLAQQLLLRALIAALLDVSPTPSARRWGTGCTIVFCCRISCGAIFAACSGLQAGGYAFEPDWFAPHFRVSLPALRPRALRRSELELRKRWSRGTCWAKRLAPVAPYVTSIPRSNVCKCMRDGSTGDRYVVTCNGRRGAVTADGDATGIRCRGSLSRLAAARLLASHDSSACAAGVRLVRHLERPFHRRLHVSRRPSRRAQLRDFPVNAYEAEARAGALYPLRPYPGPLPPLAAETNRNFPARSIYATNRHADDDRNLAWCTFRCTRSISLA